MGAGVAGAPPLPDFFALEIFDSVPSTNALAKARAAEGAAEGTLLMARRQTAGYGRRGRSWSSPEGNLACSLILRPTAASDAVAQLSFVAAVAVAEGIAGLMAEGGARIRLKWPNDILLDGKKLAGLLLEASFKASSVEWVVLGIGVNILNHPDDVAYRAISLAEAGTRANARSVLAAIAVAFPAFYRQWLAEGFGPIRQAWLNWAWIAPPSLDRVAGLGQRVEVRLERETIQGRFAGLSDRGALILDTDDRGRIQVAAGDVYGLPS